MTDAVSPPQTVRVWDVPTRLFHWSLAVLVLMSFLTGEYEWPNVPLPHGTLHHMTIHMWCGYVILALLLFRIAWGVIGSDSARFRQFVRGPRAIAAYLRGFMQDRFGRATQPFIGGHNPAGGAMVVTMLAALLVQAVTGLYAKEEDDVFGIAEGPLHGSVSAKVSKVLGDVHYFNHEFIEILVYVHILANLFYWLVRREDLIAGMIAGRRSIPSGQTASEITFAPSGRAVLAVMIAAVAVWAAITLLRK